MHRFRVGVSVAVGAFALLGASPAANAAEKILIVQNITGSILGSAAGPAAREKFTALGYDATILESADTFLPSNLASYTQVYVISLKALADTEAPKLVDFVKAGGRLFVSGERPAAANDAMVTWVQDQLVKPLVKNSSMLTLNPGAQEGGDPMTAYDNLTFGGDEAAFSTTPQALTKLVVGDPGTIGNLDAKNAWAKDPVTSLPVGALWMRDEINANPGVRPGCLMLLMDVNFWNVDGEGGPLTAAEVEDEMKNIEDFMTFCGDHTDGGAASGTTPPSSIDGGGGGVTGAPDGGAGATQPTAGNAVAGDDSGCGCHEVGRPSRAGVFGAGLALAGLVIARTRRRAR